MDGGLCLGGIARTRKVCQIAERAGMEVTPQSAKLGLVTMCTIHLLGTIPNAGPYLERMLAGPAIAALGRRGCASATPGQGPKAMSLSPMRPARG